MTLDDMASLHTRAFAGQDRAWSRDEFGTLLSGNTVFSVGGTEAFAIGRAVAGEAELLTIATAPEARRKGLARAVLRAFEAEAERRNAVQFFLEVSEDNTAALALYRAEGYAEVARRAAYYRRPDGRPVDALIMEKRAF